jgi:hypothetical protein
LAAWFAGAGVAIWALATSALPVDARIGLVLGVVAIPAFSPVVWYHIATNSVFRHDQDDGYLTPKDGSDRPGQLLRVLTGTLAGGVAAALCFALGVGLWKLFTSSLSDAAKIGVSVGGVGFPLFFRGVFSTGRTRRMNPSRATRCSSRSRIACARLGDSQSWPRRSGS